MFLFGTTLFSNRWNIIGLYLLSALVVLQRVLFYDWGGASLPTLYGYMSSTFWVCETLIGGYWRAWELWMYAYFSALAPKPIEEIPGTVPFSQVHDGQLRCRTRENFMFFQQYFDTVTAREITWQLWDVIPSGARFAYETARVVAHYHIRFKGPICCAWFLSERFVRQTLSSLAQFLPMAPPASMRETHKLFEEEVIQFMVGLDVDFFHMEGDYTTFIQTHLMPPLTSIRGGEGVRAPAARGRREDEATRALRRRSGEAGDWMARATYYVDLLETFWRDLPNPHRARISWACTCRGSRPDSSTDRVHRAGPRAGGFLDGDGTDEPGSA
ncbi:hypothetical protein LOK49_LG01G03919 [Camellia lanceoleosa]|uniref:Uncharacterized protein n=1 Tax=Camellia lanceoleosa TaxID=1840588 RepID=A0ACC0J6K4_9ERIC|nr:hypothetical protein LOK49_LG01G03919 [Camellia lanceoleosa]